MQALVQNLQNHPIGGAPRDKRGEFLKGRPPVFSHATDPLEVDDWLHAVEKQLNIAQCDDQQKVLYASGQLQGEAQDWWAAFEYDVPLMLLLSPGRSLERILDPTKYLKD